MVGEDDVLPGGGQRCVGEVFDLLRVGGTLPGFRVRRPSTIWPVGEKGLGVVTETRVTPDRAFFDAL